MDIGAGGVVKRENLLKRKNHIRNLKKGVNLKENLQKEDLKDVKFI